MHLCSLLQIHVRVRPRETATVIYRYMDIERVFFLQLLRKSSTKWLVITTPRSTTQLTVMLDSVPHALSQAK